MLFECCRGWPGDAGPVTIAACHCYRLSRLPPVTVAACHGCRWSQVHSSTDATPGPSKKRVICAGCERPASVCICSALPTVSQHRRAQFCAWCLQSGRGSVPHCCMYHIIAALCPQEPIALQGRLLILRHPLEVKRALATGECAPRHTAQLLARPLPHPHPPLVSIGSAFGASPTSRPSRPGAPHLALCCAVAVLQKAFLPGHCVVHNARVLRLGASPEVDTLLQAVEARACPLLMLFPGPGQSSSMHMLLARLALSSH